MADGESETKVRSGKGFGCVTFCILFLFVVTPPVLTNGPAMLHALGWGQKSIGPGDGDKERLMVAVERTAARAGGERFVLRQWGSTEQPFKLEEGESLTISQREVRHGNETSDQGDRGQAFIRVLEQGPKGQLIETSYGAAMADWKFTYRVAGTSVTPISIKSLDALHLLALLLVSILLADMLNRLLAGLFKRGFSGAKSDKAPPSAP